MNSFDHSMKKYFGVVSKSQSYLNLLYLMLSCPLGIFYFIFIVSGISIGLGLSIVVVGLIILAGVLAISWGMIVFERKLAISLLRIEIPPMSIPDKVPAGNLEKVKAFLINPVTWKGLLYLLCRLPLGIINFTAVITIAAVLIALVAAPFAYQWATYDLGFTQIQSLSEALLLCIAGLIVTPAGLHLLNFLARLQAEFARIMLGTIAPHEIHQPRVG